MPENNSRQNDADAEISELLHQWRKLNCDLESAAARMAVSQVERSRPITTAPIGGPDHFPPKTPGREPLRHVLLWWPAHDRSHDRWPGGWRLGYWGGPDEPHWYSDDMALLDPQPSHWSPLPADPSAGDLASLD